MERNPAVEKFNARDGLFVLIIAAATAVFAAIALTLFPRAFTEASIEFKVGRDEARRIAADYLTDLGASVAGDRFAGIFDADDIQKVFFERTQGLDAANRIYTDDIRLWRWQLRWFRPLRKEEIRVAVTPAGQVVGFRREIPREEPGAFLTAEEARGIAERFLDAKTDLPVGDLTFVESKIEEQAARRDHSFTWEKTGWNVDGAVFRVQVDVFGDEIGVFRQAARIPEQWQLEYEQLRSRNTTATTVATFFYILTGLAALVFMIRYARRGDVPWRFVLAFSGIGAALSVLNALNELPVALYSYDTTESFGSFLGTRILGAVTSGLVVGGWIGLFAAGGEPLYRRRFPGQMSLSRFITLRGVRTKSFFRQLLIGYALTAFFMAYQAVFYIVSAHFGAWSPAEVPYSNLLNTRFPWVAVLLIGFLPAVSEEFSSRMFSIPFYEKLVRNPAVAVLLAGFIWGFLHANYPNQPFYIRGLEVGIVGVAMGALMYRFGVFPLLVWHFTVDALYTSILLLRSGNSYFAISGGIAAGALVLPLVMSLVFYARRGGFRPEDDLTNAAHGSAPEPEAAADPVTEAAPATPVEPRPVSRGLAITAAAAVIVAALFLVLPTDYPPRDLVYPMSRGDAREAARRFVAAQGADPDSYKVVTVPATGFDSWAAGRSNLPPYLVSRVSTRYVSETGGLEAWRRLVSGPLHTSLWTTRFVKPLSPDEWNVVVDPRRGRVVGFAHRVPEARAGADLDEAAAGAVADSLIASLNVAGIAWTRAAATSEKAPARRDWSFVYDDSAGAVGQAVPRLTVVVRGDRPAGYGVTLRTPEAYERARLKSTPLSAALLILRVLVFGGLLGMVLLEVIGAIRREPFPWRRLILIALPAAVPVALFLYNRAPSLLERYPAEIPWNIFLLTGTIGMLLWVVLYTALFLGILIVIQVARPAWLAEIRPGALRFRAGHAVTVAITALALGVWADRLELLGRIRWPHLFPGPTPPVLPSFDAAIPFFDLVWSAVTASLLTGFVLAGMDLLLRGPLRSHARRWLLALFISIALGPDHAHSAAEAIVPTLFEVLALGLAFAVAVKGARGNILVYIAVLPLAWGGQQALFLMQEPLNEARVHGAAALLVLCLPLLVLIGSALFRRGRGR